MAIKLFSSSFYLFYLLTILPLCFTSTTCAILSNETDRLALLEIKARVTDDPRGAMMSWNNSIHFCQWRGVTCNRIHQRVIVLDLHLLNLAGSISPYIGNLTFLREVHLQKNEFGGAIPLEVGRLPRLQFLDLGINFLVGEIPVNLTRCRNLINLYLDVNTLEGKIPPEIGSLVKLQVLYARVNNFVGNIPFSIGNMSSLVELYLGRNHLSGSIPDSLSQLKSLNTFAVATNKFDATIPPSVFNLSSMETFDVGSNQLQGTLPPNLFISFPRLVFFSIANNTFSGTIPSSLSNASNLEGLFLTWNNLTGKVPYMDNLHKLKKIVLGINSLGYREQDDLNFLSSFTNITSLLEIQIGTNNLGGALPESVGNLSSKLTVLVLEDTQVVGKIPIGIGSLRNLDTLSFRGNHLNGNIPEEIGNLANLQILLLGDNEFIGNIPSSIGNLKKLIKLYLKSGNFQGTIPQSLGNCTNLMVADFSDNDFSGNIPAQILNISSLAVFLDLSQNQLTGALPIEVGNLNGLGELYIFGNKLSGEIPSSLGSCVSLELLDMSGNFFNGTIPSSLSSLKALKYFDVSRNNLIGQIPEFFESFVLLENLNLSFNDFVGVVPKKGVFKNASIVSIQGNNKLCGGIQEFHLPLCNFNESTKTKRLTHKLKIIMYVVLAFLGAVAATISFLLLWSRKRRVQIASTTSNNALMQVSYRTLFKATGGFSSSNLIGVGSFSSVYKGTLDQERDVAVKVFNLQRRGAFRSFIVECEAMKNIRHRNLLKVVTACSSIDAHGNDFKALVYEFMANGSLDEWLHPTQESRDDLGTTRNLNMRQRLNIAIDVASGLDYLHHQYSQTPIVHCDLKPSNVLLDGEMAAQIGDFGLVKFLLNETSNLSLSATSSAGVKGSVGYAAPEYGMGSEASTHGDLYSFGILILEMFSGKKPTDDMFNGNMNLHNYVKMALPEQVAEIVEPVLFREDGEEDETETRDERNQKVIESLVSIFKIGVACSEEVPRERLGTISDVVAQLVVIRNNLADHGGHATTQSTTGQNQVPRRPLPEA